MSSLSAYTQLSNMIRVQSQCSCKSLSTLPSTLELPKPIISRSDDAEMEKARGDTLIKLCGSYPGVAPRISDLPEALAFLRAIRHYRTPFSSFSSSESGFPLPTRETHVISRLPCDPTSAGRIAEWRQTLEPTCHPDIPSSPNDLWHSFLPSCASSTASSASSHYEPYAYPIISNRPGDVLSYQPGLEEPHRYEDEAGSQVNDENEDEMWPYDGKGLYEHHPKVDCGNACYSPCRLRRKFRPRLAKLAQKFVPWFRDGKQSGKRIMKNSDIPHPPWALEYRSNDDSLDEDHDDGDLEVWLEYFMEKERFDHELRLELRLDGVGRAEHVVN